jgi:hypothetical protein
MAEQTIRAPDKNDIQRLARQVVDVGTLTERHVGRSLANDDTDLDAIQYLLDRPVLDAGQTYELQCLGIVLGRRLVPAIEGLAWCVVEDEYGVDPALRYLDTSLILFPLTMISKRVEAGEHVNVRAMFEGVRARVAELAEVVSRPH